MTAYEKHIQHLVHISKNQHKLENSNSLATYLGVRASTSEMNEVVVSRDPPSPSHQKSLALQDKVGEVRIYLLNHHHLLLPHLLRMSVQI